MVVVRCSSGLLVVVTVVSKWLWCKVAIFAVATVIIGRSGYRKWGLRYRLGL